MMVIDKNGDLIEDGVLWKHWWLKDGEPEPFEGDYEKWLSWHRRSDAERLVDHNKIGGADIITVFDGIERSFEHIGQTDDGRNTGPLVYATVVILDGQEEGEVVAIAGTKEEAKLEHSKTLMFFLQMKEANHD